MNNYMECFDEILSAAEAGLSEEQMKKILNKSEIKECFRNGTFRGDFTALCVAKNYAAGLNAAKDIFKNYGKKKYPESISFFVPLLSGKNRRTAELSCSELAENAFGLNALNFSDNFILGYNSMLYMFIAGDCAEAVRKFLDAYKLMGVPDDSLSDYIRIGAKRRKTGIIKLFAERGFTVTEEDIRYLYDRDAEYADMLIESGIIAVNYESENLEEEMCGDIQRLKNWTIKTDIDRIEISGNVYDSQHGLPDGRFYSFEASYCTGLNDDEFIVCEKGVNNNNSYILRYDGELKDSASSGRTARLEEIFEFCKNNTADYEKMAELLLSDGDSLAVPGIGFSGRTIQKGEYSEDRPCYIYHYHPAEKTMTRSVLNKKKDLPAFRMSGRDFYACFDMLAEIFDDIMNGKRICEYAEKIRKMLDSEIGVREKHQLIKMLFTCLRYYASEENYIEGTALLKEYGLDNIAMQCYDSTEFVFDLLNAEGAETKASAYQRISFRPDLNVFSIVPFYVGSVIGAINEAFEFRYFRSEDVSKILCWLAEKRERSALLKFSHMRCNIKDTDMLELTLRSPHTVYELIQNDFYDIVPDNLKKDGVIMSVDEMIRKLAHLDFTDTGYFALISHMYTFFDKKDLEFALSRMPKITRANARELNEIYRNEANYFIGAYGGKPEIACYFDRLFSETVYINGEDFAIHPVIKKELRSKLTDHRFIVTVHHLNDIILGLPKNFDLILPPHIDGEKLLNGLVKAENRHMMIAAVRHNIIDDRNVYRVIQYAVKNHCYVSLKTLYRIFNFKDRKRYNDNRLHSGVRAVSGIA